MATNNNWASLSSEVRSSSQDKIDMYGDVVDDACRRYNALASIVEPTLRVLRVLSLPEVYPIKLHICLY